MVIRLIGRWTVVERYDNCTIHLRISAVRLHYLVKPRDLVNPWSVRLTEKITTYVSLRVQFAFYKARLWNRRKEYSAAYVPIDFFLFLGYNDSIGEMNFGYKSSWLFVWYKRKPDVASRSTFWSETLRAGSGSVMKLVAETICSIFWNLSDVLHGLVLVLYEE